MYKLTIKKAYRSYAWDANKQNDWQDEVETFDGALDALAGLLYAMQEYPENKIVFKFEPGKAAAE